MASLPFKGQFSFINKDANNIASTDHRNAVAWHVMHRYEPFRRRKQSAGRSPEKSPSQSPPAIAHPQLDHHQPMIVKLIKFTNDELVPQVWPEGDYDGLLSGWRELSPNTRYDYYDNAYVALLATIMSVNSVIDIDATQLYQTAIANVEQHATVTTRLLKATLCLFSVQTILGHSDTARGLLKMLSRHIDSTNGINALPTAFRLDVLSNDVFFALRHKTRPLFLTKHWSVGKLHESWRQRLGPKCDVASLKDFPTILDVMAALHELHASKRAFNNLDDQLQQWQRFRHLECLSHLAGHHVSLNLYPHQYSEPQIELILTNAALLFAVMTLGSAEPVRIGHILYNRLKDSLLQLESRELAKRMEVFRSILLLGTLGERVFAGEVGDCVRRLKGLLNEANGPGPFVEKGLLREVRGNTRARGMDIVSGLYVAGNISWRAPAKDGGQIESL